VRPLLVALNSDVSARALGKGPGRPLNDEHDRALVLAALQAVDFVVLFDEPTPCELIARIRPDVYVKGGDYDVERLREAELVRGWGGRAVAIPFVSGYSTTSLVRTHPRPLKRGGSTVVNRAVFLDATA